MQSSKKLTVYSIRCRSYKLWRQNTNLSTHEPEFDTFIILYFLTLPPQKNILPNIIRALHDTLTIRARAGGARSRCRRFFRPTYRLKGRKNGGFRADPLAKYRRLSFFCNLFKDFRKFLYAKMRHVPLRTGALASATLVI